MSARPSPLIPLAPEAARCFGWLEESYLQTVVAALEAAEPGSVCFVGGCVRDSLAGAAPKDFDIATPLEPHAVMAALKKAGVRAVPTGVDHGTVTAAIEHKGVEITTLRADVSTDGRRATVAFTRDWTRDAERRDFRINAIYLTPDRRLYDPVGGIEDLRAQRVRFIGAAEARIREDYLRILRFFRFSARFAHGFDPEGLTACRKLKTGIAQLSAERVGDEFSKILRLPAAPMAVETMRDAGVLAEIWPAAPALEALRTIKGLAPDAGAPLGLAALFGEEGRRIDARLRLSNADAARRKRAIAGAARLRADFSEKEARANQYRLGRETFLDAVLLAAATSGEAEGWRDLIAFSKRMTPPEFPLSGKDVIEAGVEPGPKVAQILKAAEEAWIGEDFPPAARARELLRDYLAG
ncbi:MAG: CCA tRNA nucleotidyltransferase [Parvularculaceae bacterium]